MSYLILATEEEASNRSRDAWEAVLGRKKHAQDVTEFLWDIDVGKDGRCALVISEKAELLTSAEAGTSVATLPIGKGENWDKTVTATEVK